MMYLRKRLIYIKKSFSINCVILISYVELSAVGNTALIDLYHGRVKQAIDGTLLGSNTCTYLSGRATKHIQVSFR